MRGRCGSGAGADCKRDSCELDSHLGNYFFLIVSSPLSGFTNKETRKNTHTHTQHQHAMS